MSHGTRGEQNRSPNTKWQRYRILDPNQKLSAPKSIQEAIYETKQVSHSVPTYGPEHSTVYLADSGRSLVMALKVLATLGAGHILIFSCAGFRQERVFFPRIIPQSFF
jgi:hypothetical protein